MKHRTMKRVTTYIMPSHERKKGWGRNEGGKNAAFAAPGDRNFAGRGRLVRLESSGGARRLRPRRERGRGRGGARVVHGARPACPHAAAGRAPRDPGRAAAMVAPRGAADRDPE